MFEFKFPTVLLRGLCVHVCMCRKGRLRGRLGGIVGGAWRKREGTHSGNFHHLYSLVTVLYHCFISADDTQKDATTFAGARQRGGQSLVPIRRVCWHIQTLPCKYLEVEKD